MRNARLDESQAGIKIARRNINNLRYADDTTLMAKNEDKLKSLLIRVKEETEKAGIKLNIKKTKIMVSVPITSWHIDGKKADLFWQVTDLFSWAPKSLQTMTTAMKLKDASTFGRKAMTNLESILKSRGISLLIQVHIVKAIFFQYLCMDVRIRP